MAQNYKSYELEELDSVKTKKPVYKGSFEDGLKAAYDKLASRPAFSYDMKNDPLYAQYKDSFARQGKMAMKDTVGQASALTGGYANSYAQSLGQQQYDAHLTKLGDIVPELYELAYSRYQAQGDELTREYDMLSGLRDREYKNYVDELERYDAAEKLRYEREQDEKAFAEKQAEQSYNRRLNEAATLAKYGDFSGYADIYGETTAQSMKKYWIAANPDTAYNLGLVDAAGYFAMTGKYAPGQAPAANTSSGHSGSYYPSTAPDGRDASVVQRELRNMGYNIAVDGAWGPRSQSAWDKAYGGGSKASASGGMELGYDPNYLVRV